MEKKDSGFSIKSWAEDDQPRAKLAQKGTMALSNSELLAILIGSGTKEISAVELCKRILSSVEGDLAALGKLTIQDLQKFKGIGQAKAITILAALELGRRRKFSAGKDKPHIVDSKSAYEVIAPFLLDKVTEEFWILYLDRSHRLIESCRISSGGVSGTVVDSKVVFSKALQLLASSIVLCHNHPSGQLKPSKYDLQITRKIKESGQMLDISVIDHLIVGHGNYLSMADEGLI
ncbi:MAG: DNA repair protein RadC [Saprospiraceae bacterium]|nr:DNA repair protein RadC [Saprospiraceae bacterium]